MKKGSSVVPALVKIIRQGTIPLLGAVLAAGAAYGAGLDREAPDLSRGWTRDLNGRGQLVARSTAGFEPGRLEVEPGAEVKITRGSEGVTARAERPDWVVALVSAGSLEGGSIAAGEVGTVPAARAATAGCASRPPWP